MIKECKAYFFFKFFSLNCRLNENKVRLVKGLEVNYKFNKQIKSQDLL